MTGRPNPGQIGVTDYSMPELTLLADKRVMAIAGKFFALALFGVALWIAWSTR
jgi:hypothetical protein